MEYIIPDFKIKPADLNIKSLTPTNNISYLLRLGFHSYYTDNIKKLYDPKYPVRIRSQFKGKYKKYKITQPFNYTIQKNDNIDKNIITIESEFKKKYNYSSTKQDFYKLWEVLIKYNIVGKTNKCTDIYSEKIIELLGKKISDKKYDTLIINNRYKLNVDQEKNFIKSFLSRIPLLDNLNTHGNLVIKIYTIYTQMMIDLIILLSKLFKTSYIYIPYTVESYRNEKYLVLMNYNPNDKIITFLKSLDKYYINLGIQTSNINFFININLTEQLKQVVSINKIEEYVRNNNYFGEEYEKYYNDALDKSKQWVAEFIKKK